MCTFSPPVAPTQAKLSSRYGIRPARRPPHLPTFHAGIDLGVQTGIRSRDVTIYAVQAGRVELVALDATRRGPTDGYGNCVAIRHETSAGPRWSFYAHMSAHAQGLEPGVQLRAGTPIGRMGNTSNGKFPGMGAHLHFEVRHAWPDGRAPFPGPYPRVVGGRLNNPLNEDPQAFLAERGVTFGPRGVILVQLPACIPERFV